MINDNQNIHMIDPGQMWQNPNMPVTTQLGFNDIQIVLCFCK